LTGSLGRIVAIALALSVVIGAWLLFEYSEASRQRQAAEQSLGGPDASGPRAVDPSPSSAGPFAIRPKSPLTRLDDLLVP
jgi:hypothetical protein